MIKAQTIPADSDRPCDCCRRFHRKLFHVGGYWLGRDCAQQYEFYMREPRAESSMWIGYEKQYERVRRMVRGR